MHQFTPLSRKKHTFNERMQYIINWYLAKMTKGVDLNKKSYEIARQCSNFGFEYGSKIMTNEAKITLMLMIKIYVKIKKLQNHVNDETYMSFTKSLLEVFFYYCITKNTLKIARRRKYEHEYNMRIKENLMKRMYC
jgi:hypothetical protein